MPRRTVDQLRAEILARVEDNTTGAITPADVRSVLNDIIDSFTPLPVVPPAVSETLVFGIADADGVPLADPAPITLTEPNTDHIFTVADAQNPPMPATTGQRFYVRLDSRRTLSRVENLVLGAHDVTRQWSQSGVDSAVWYSERAAAFTSPRLRFTTAAA